MKISNKNLLKKTMAPLIAMIMILTISVTIFSLPTAIAHTPPQQVKTYAFVTATPSPAGVGQQVLIVFWLNWVPPTAGGTTGDRWQGFRIDITKPNGDVDHLGPFVSDPVGSAYTPYTPAEIGEYKVNFTFPGQVLQAAGYTGILGPGANNAYVNDTFTASSANTTFTVQQESIPLWSQPPLPVSYWERPIDTMNTYWYVLGSHWLGQSEQGLNYLRYQSVGRAPSTAHVMWTKPISFGGIVGGSNVGSGVDVNFYSGTAYQFRFANPLILYGRLFYTLPLANNPSGGGYTSVDLRTGETIWTQNIPSPSFGQLFDFESPNQHGVNPNGYLWITGTVTGTGITNPNPIATTTNASYTSAVSNSSAPVSTSGWIAIDPMTGNKVFNETNIPSGTRWWGPAGEVMITNIGRENTNAPYTYMWQWNNTKLPGNDIAGGITAWTPGTTNWNMSKSYDWNVTLSQPLPAGSNTAIIQVFPGDLVFGRSSSLQFAGSTGANTIGTPDPYTLWAVNLNASRGQIGQVMWIQNYTGSADMSILMGPRDQKTNVFTTYFKETVQWNGYSLLTGEKLWGPTQPEEAWNFYGGTTGLTAPYASGDGIFYSAGYSGVLYAYDYKTGKTLFTYGNDVNNPKNNTRTPNTAYGDYPYQVAAVGDGKAYLISSEHSLNAPPFQGAEARCVNATTGEEIWKILGMTNWQEVALADGYFVYLNLNDMRIYAVGPGPSATAVSASPSVITEHDGVLITGSVTDQSPNTALKGTAAISDADQGAWMDYMVMKNVEKPNVKGVEVSLDTIDPNGNYIHIDTVTSDSSGIFKKMWTPEVPGEYTIIATFAGSGSYGSSSANTAVGVAEAHQTKAPPGYPQPIDNTQTIVISAVAIIIAIIVSMVLLLLTILRRRT